jgi:UPF0271 protein
MRLNCDLGESFGQWCLSMDESVMPFIDQANIACGFHAGDPQHIRRTLKLAKQHDVMVGAHPAYPDLEGFGRRSMACSREEIIGLMHYQMSAIDGMASSLGLAMAYVKPHGALYNDMMADAVVREAVMAAVASYHRPVILMLQATAKTSVHLEEADLKGIKLWFEAFADRRYNDDGSLLARSQPDAVLGREQVLLQVEQLCQQGSVTTVSGKLLPLVADTICIHGDNVESVNVIEQLRQQINVFKARANGNENA